MAKLKQMMAGTANYRMGQIIKEFGVNSEVYQMASEYIEEHVDDKYIKKDKAGNIIGIKQIKSKYQTEEVPDDKYGKVVKITGIEEGTPDSVFGRSDIFNTYLPSPTQIFSTVKAEEGIKGSVKENKQVLRPLVEAYAHKMRSYDTTVSDVYDVKDNVDALDADVYSAHDFYSRAVSILQYREKTSEWIDAAKALVEEYDIQVQLERQSRT